MSSGKRVTVPRPVKGVPKRKGAPSIVEGEASTSSHGASPSNKAIALLRVPAGPYTSHTADGSPIALSHLLQEGEAGANLCDLRIPASQAVN